MGKGLVARGFWQFWGGRALTPAFSPGWERGKRGWIPAFAGMTESGMIQFGDGVVGATGRPYRCWETARPFDRLRVSGGIGELGGRGVGR